MKIEFDKFNLDRALSNVTTATIFMLVFYICMQNGRVLTPLDIFDFFSTTGFGLD